MIDRDLAEELELACIDAMRGDPPGPGMAKRLERTVTDLFYRKGIEGRVEARSDHRGTKVAVGIMPPGQPPQKIVLTLG